jgi:hypothetical protein
MTVSKRFERVERESFRITPRDRQIIEAVFAARYLTTQLVATLLFTPTTLSSCKQRLRCLYDLKYLDKRRTQVNEPDIYYLGLRGKRYILSLGEYSKEDIERIAGVAGEEAGAPNLMMRHELTLAWLYVRARLECARYGWNLCWKNTRMLEMLKLGLEPDARIEVSYGERRRQAYLEFTAVMPTPSEMAGKLARYEAHWEKAALPAERAVKPATGSAVVLWLTTSQKNLSMLREAVRKSAYRDCFLLGLVENAGSLADADSFLTGEMWWWSEAEQKMQWIKPSEAILYRPT